MMLKSFLAAFSPVSRSGGQTGVLRGQSLLGALRLFEELVAELAADTADADARARADAGVLRLEETEFGRGRPARAGGGGTLRPAVEHPGGG